MKSILIAGGAGVTIREYATTLCAMVGFDQAAIQYDTDRYVGVQQKVFDTDEFRRLFAFRFTDVRGGITEVVEDHVDHFVTE